MNNTKINGSENKNEVVAEDVDLNIHNKNKEVFENKTKEEVITEQKKPEVSKQNEKKESWIKNKFEIWKTKLNIRYESLSPQRQKILEKLKASGSGIAVAGAKYTEIMNSGPTLFKVKTGQNPDGTDKFYKYTYQKLALHAATVMAFGPAGAVGAGKMLGTKITSSVAGTLLGTAAIAGINKMAYEKIAKIEVKKEGYIKAGDTKKTAKMERNIKYIKWAAKYGSLIAGVGVAVTASAGISSLSNSLGNLEIPAHESNLSGNNDVGVKSGQSWFDKIKNKIGFGDDKENIEIENENSIDDDTENTTETKPETTTKSPAENATPEKEELIDLTVEDEKGSIPQEALIDGEKNIGVTYAFKSQLEANHDLAEKMGYPIDGTEHEKALFLKGLGKDYGYIGEDGDVRVDAKMGAAYELKLDDEGNVVVNEYENGKLIETHSKGDTFESGDKLEKYESSHKATINQTNESEGKGDYGIKGPQTDPDGNLLEQDGKIENDNAIKGPQTDPDGKLLGPEDLVEEKHEGIEQTEQIHSTDKSLAEKQVDPIETKVKIVDLEKTMWAHPEKVDVDYYLDGGKSLDTLDKATLEALIKKGEVIDVKKENALGILVHDHYEMKGAKEILALQEKAKDLNEVLGRNAVKTEAYPGETMEHYKERIADNIATAISREENITRIHGGYSNEEIQRMKNQSDMKHEYLQERKLNMYEKNHFLKEIGHMVANIFNRKH